MTRSDGKEEIDQSTAGHHLGILPQALGVWTRRPGAPVVRRKGKPFCLWPDFPRWREKELDRVAREEAKSGPASDAELRYDTARARKMELEVAHLEGSLVTVEEAARPVDAMLTRLRSQLITLPQRWAPQLVGLGTIPKVQGVLSQAIEETMLTL